MLKYYPNVVLFDEEKANGVGIITGWKTPRLIHDELSSDALEKVVSIGPLYTKNGINFIIANLFLRRKIYVFKRNFSSLKKIFMSFVSILKIMLPLFLVID